MKIPYLLFFCSLSFVVFSFDLKLTKELNEVWDDYDIYVFAIQWGATMCKTKGDSCYEKMKIVPKHSMTIHGLWPSMSSGSTLPYCNGDSSDISVIDDGSATFLEMRKYWPSLTGANKDFWEHEYNKHGYCVNMKYKKEGTEVTYYFQKTLDLFKEQKLDTLIIDICGDAEDGEYVLPDDFKESLNQKVGENTYSLRCTKIGGNYYLSEIRFKLDLNFKYTTKGKNQSSCPNNKYIYVDYI